MTTMNKVYVVKYPNGKICGVYTHEPSSQLMNSFGRDYETNELPRYSEYDVIDNVK